MRACRLAVGVFSVWALCVVGVAQEVFELVVPAEAAKSAAELTDTALVITDAQNQVFRYARAPQHDSPDGSFLGFANLELNQVIRWPANGRGLMLIGEPQAGQILFRESRMRVQRVGSPATPSSQRTGIGSPIGEPTSRSTRMHVATVVSGGQYVGGYVGQDGLLRFAVEQNGQWALQTPADNTRFPPGTPLTLAEEPGSALPAAYLIDEDGCLTHVFGRGNVRTLTPPQFPRRGHLASIVRHGRPLLFGVDRDGNLLEVSPDDPRGMTVRPIASGMVPGGPLAALGGNAAISEVLLVDAQAALRRYRKVDGWTRSDPRDAWGQTLSLNLAPGSWLSASKAVPPGGTKPTTHLALVDAFGQMQILNQVTSEVWDHRLLPDVGLNPGAPVAISAQPEGLLVSAVGPDGGWHAWHARQADGAWTRSLISRGLRPFGPVAFPPIGPYGFAIDVRGNLLAAHYAPPGLWTAHVCAPHFVQAPRVVSREVIANPPLPPVNVQLVNRHDRELWVLIADLRNPSATMRLKIRPGESKSIELARDSGGEIVETFAFPGPVGTAVQQQSFGVPPETLYDVSVYELFLQSVAIDRTKRGAGKIEDVNWSPKSIGVFPIPPGELIREGQVIDVLDAARQEQNPGAVRKLDLEQWKEPAGGTSL